MKTIGITQRTMFYKKHNEQRDCLDSKWFSFFIEANIFPILIPNSIHLLPRYLEKIAFDGFLLTGGNDSNERKQVETTLLNLSIQEQVPLIGVCHGMQAIQKHFGTELVKVENHIMKSQEIHVYNKSTLVNSYHDFGTTQKTPDFTTWALSREDGVIKAIRHVNLPLLGIMWHPERFSPFRQKDLELFKTFYEGNK